MKRKGNIWVGTSGWSYAPWKGRFYPEDLKAANQLDFYQQQFNTVELNNSFYRLPKPETFAAWAKAVPEDFIYAVKGSRFFTHMKKLNLTKEELKPFFNAVKKLKSKLGPILFQLPPNWKLNLERLHHFIKLLPKGYRYAFEFRNETWYVEEVYALLREHQCAFCWYHLAGHLSPLEVTADFVYIRLHGPGDKYQGSYTDDDLRTWAKQCQVQSAAGKDVYIYFDNDQLAYAAFNAQELRRRMAKA